MSSDPFRPARPWFERALVAAMVVVGFAVGSVGLTVVAELASDDPVLTDEFNAPVADPDDGDPEATVAVTTPPSTTAPPAEGADDDGTDDEADADGGEDVERRRDGHRGDRRGGDGTDRDARERT